MTMPMSKRCVSDHRINNGEIQSERGTQGRWFVFAPSLPWANSVLGPFFCLLPVLLPSVWSAYCRPSPPQSITPERDGERERESEIDR